jgi:predicted RNase H-like HicB family nuclease
MISNPQPNVIEPLKSESEINTLNLQKMNVMKTYQFTAEITRDNEINQYIGIVPVLPGAHTQASTLDELQKNLKEVIQLCLGEMTEEEINNIPDFVGIQQISVAV